MIKAEDKGDRIKVTVSGDMRENAYELASIFNAIINRYADAPIEDAGAMLIGTAMKMSKLGEIAKLWNSDNDTVTDISLDDLLLAAIKEARGE